MREYSMRVFINCNRNTDPFRAQRRHSKNGRPLYIVRCHKIILRDGMPSITRLNERSLRGAATRTLRVRSDNKRCARLRSKLKFLALGSYESRRGSIPRRGNRRERATCNPLGLVTRVTASRRVTSVNCQVNPARYAKQMRSNFINGEASNEDALGEISISNVNGIPRG